MTDESAVVSRAEASTLTNRKTLLAIAIIALTLAVTMTIPLAVERWMDDNDSMSTEALIFISAFLGAIAAQVLGATLSWANPAVQRRLVRIRGRQVDLLLWAGAIAWVLPFLLVEEDEWPATYIVLLGPVLLGLALLFTIWRAQPTFTWKFAGLLAIPWFGSLIASILLTALLQSPFRGICAENAYCISILGYGLLSLLFGGLAAAGTLWLFGRYGQR